MKIKHFPNLRQTHDYDCGAQAIQSVLAYYGIDVRESEIMELAGTTEHGTFPGSIKKVVQDHGLSVDFREMSIEEVKQHIDKKIPVILLLQAWAGKGGMDWQNDWENGHYAIAIGYDKSKIYFEDPASIFRTYLTYDELRARWHDTDRDKKYVNYGMAVYGKTPAYHPEKVIHMD